MSEGRKESSPVFEPVNKAHAIVEMVLFCHFEPEFDESAISSLMELEDDLKEELPRFRQVHGNYTEIDLSGQGLKSYQTRLVGIEMRKAGSEGSAEWLLRTDPFSVSVHCLDYTRWEEVGAKALDFLRRALHKIGATQSTPTALGLKYIDRFSYGGTEDRYDPALLFRRDTTLLHQRAFTSGMRWHCHSGWFEPLDNLPEELECLNQVNIDAAFLTVSGARRHMTTIDHNAVVKGRHQENLADFLASNEDEHTLLHRLTETLHLVNKRVLMDLLTDEMAMRIHLAHAGTKV